MASTDEILDQINDAIADWETGPDAMRCNAPTRAPMAPGRIWIIPADMGPIDVSCYFVDTDTHHAPTLAEIAAAQPLHYVFTPPAEETSR